MHNDFDKCFDIICKMDITHPKYSDKYHENIIKSLKFVDINYKYLMKNNIRRVSWLKGLPQPSLHQSTGLIPVHGRTNTHGQYVKK